MEHSKLSQHKFKKGKFVTPFNELEGLREDSWFKDNLPEYIWIGLIIKMFGKEEGLNICASIIKHITFFGVNLNTLRLSDVFSLKVSYQRQFWLYVKSLVGLRTLNPLSVLFTFSEQPVFSEIFNDGSINYEKRLFSIKSILQDMADHQSYLSTDVRFIILYYQIAKGKMQFVDGIHEEIFRYPNLSHDDEEMGLAGSIVRSAEMSVRGMYKKNYCYLNRFWENLSRMTDCKMFFIEYKEDNKDADIILEKYKKLLSYYAEIFTTIYTFDEKTEVLLGIATYSFKRFSELVTHNLYNEISGRSIIRVLIENYIMLKYLLNNESSHDNIWNEFKQYGIGQYKLIALRKEEKYSNVELSNSHVQYEYLHLLVKEHKDEEFTDMETSYFNKASIREKAIEVGEKELFDLYYDYDSAFEHGLWGAIRESSMLRCDESCHQFHIVPDVNNEQKMKSVWDDCVKTMDKIFSVLESIYGSPSK